MAPHLFLRFVSSIGYVLDCTETAHMYMYNLSDRVEHKVQGDTEHAGAGRARRATGNKLVSYNWRNTTKQNLYTFQSYNYNNLSHITSQLYSTPWLEETWSKLTFQMRSKAVLHEPTSLGSTCSLVPGSMEVSRACQAYQSIIPPPIPPPQPPHTGHGGMMPPQTTMFW